MKFMPCTTCGRVVQINNTGICLSCQGGFTATPSEDAFMTDSMKQEALEKRAKEIEDALQKPETKSVDVQKQARDGQRVGSRNPKRKKASKKGQNQKEKKER